MPIYTIRCRKCGYKFEVFFSCYGRQLALRKDKIKCLKCGEPNCETIPSVFNIRFKGNGWTKKESD